MNIIFGVIKKYLWEIILFAVAFIILSSLLINYTSAYFPGGDDISLMVNSTGLFKQVNPVKWFTDGFEDYFRTYAEWTNHSKEIVRPAVNVVFYTVGLLFGKKYFLYLYFNILIHSLGVAFVFYICKRYLELDKTISLFASFVFFLNPAILNEYCLFNLSFIFDAAVSILIFMSFLFAVKNKGFVAFLIACLALFTKETSLLTSFAVSLSFIVIYKKKKLKYLLCAFIPIVVWIIYKSIFGIGLTGGIFNDNTLMWKIHLADIYRGFLIWLAGIYNSDAGLTVSAVVLIAFNLIMFVILISDGFKKYFASDKNYFVVFSWALVSVLILISFGLNGRFGYAFHLFLIPAVVYNLKFSKPVVRKIFYFLFCLLIIFNGIRFFISKLDSVEIAKYKHKMQSAIQLNEILKSLPDNSEVLLINDYTAFFGSRYIADFAESKAKVVKINSLSDYNTLETEKNKMSKIDFLRLSDTLVVQVEIPDYIDYWFEGVNPSLFKHEEKKIFGRNEFITMNFPDEKYSGVSKLTGLNKYDFGSKMQLYVRKKGISVVWFNPAEGKYEIFRDL